MPVWGANGETVDLYYWYYGTMAMFQMQSQGEYWKHWNEAMRDMLIRHQVKEGEMRGSWDPVGLWGDIGGRVYSTALVALDLEVYYRYLPTFKVTVGAEGGTPAAEGGAAKKEAKDELKIE